MPRGSELATPSSRRDRSRVALAQRVTWRSPGRVALVAARTAKSAVPFPRNHRLGVSRLRGDALRAVHFSRGIRCGVSRESADVRDARWDRAVRSLRRDRACSAPPAMAAGFSASGGFRSAAIRVRGAAGDELALAFARARVRAGGFPPRFRPVAGAASHGAVRRLHSLNNFPAQP